MDWQKTCPQGIECPFKPARVLLQDFTGVPCVVDLAAMRDAMAELGGDPALINPQVSTLLRSAYKRGTHLPSLQHVNAVEILPFEHASRAPHSLLAHTLVVYDVLRFHV